MVHVSHMLHVSPMLETFPLQVNSKSVSDMLREVATVSPLFFKEVLSKYQLEKLKSEKVTFRIGKSAAALIWSSSA